MRRALLLLLLAITGCGTASPSGDGAAAPEPLRPHLPDATGPAVAVQIGRGLRFQPRARRLTGAPVGGDVCLPDDGVRHGAHLELFAAGRVVVIPPRVGFAPGCSHALRTRDRTGVIEVRAGGPDTVGHLFDLIGASLGPQRLLTFTGPVRAYVGGRRVDGDPRRIRLTRHAQVVLAVGPAVPVHSAFRFVPGL